MSHTAEGLLQAYMDGEVTGTAAAELETHLAGCAECAAELEELRLHSRFFTDALSRCDEPRDATAVQQAWWRARAAARRPAVLRRGSGALARAAVAVLVVAGAVAAALPGSPLRQLVERWLAPGPELAAPAATPAEPAPAPPAAAAEVVMRGTGFVPAQGKVRVLIWSAQASATIRVNLVDGERVSVEAGSEGGDEVRFRTAPDRVEVMNLGSGQAVIEIPRSLPFASVEVDGRQWLFKDGAALRLQGPVVTQTKDAVVFRTAH